MIDNVVNSSSACFSLTSTAPFWCLFAAIVGCAGADKTQSQPTGGASSVAGGSAAYGGSQTGLGGAASGGTGTVAPSSGGLNAVGGVTSTSSTVVTAGRTGTGGTSQAATGGVASSIGGSLASGGNLPTGGTATAGGTSTGGAATTGGNKATGGTPATGGLPATGGSKATGGAPATGGSKATGGAATGGAATGGSGAGGSTHSGPWKIMMLGDSITATTCYPQLVWQNLRSAGHTNFTFIGSFNNSQGCSVSGLPSGGLPTEGHSGELVVTDTNNGSVLKWFQANVPDIVVMHFGTNDVWGNPGQTTANNVLNAYTTVLANLKTVNPNAILFVAQIIPMNPSLNNCSTSSPCNYQATLDASIPAWASSHSTTAMPIYVVNLENLYNNGYFPNTTYTTDGVHPLLAGSQPMGTTMANAIIARGYF